MTDKCRGLIFRAFSNFYQKETEFVEKRGFRLLKRKSCLGCKYCGGLWDHVKEIFIYGEFDFLPINEHQVNSFKEYSVEISGDEGEEITFKPIETKDNL